MADIKQIEVSGAVYDIKDQTARNQIAAQGVTIANQQTQINGAVSTANQANQTASNLSGAVTANATAIAQLQGSARKFIMIGDSYGDGYSPDGSTTGWCDRVATYLGLTSGVNYWANHGGGACFGRNDSLSFDALLDAVAVPAEQRASITDIVIGGGYNDTAWSIENINAGMDRVKNVVASKYPNATVWVFAMGWCFNRGNRISLVAKYDEAYSRSSHANGWKYRKIYPQLHYKPLFSSDGVHPNQNGQYLIANCCAGYLVGSDIETNSAIQFVYYNGTSVGVAIRTNDVVNVRLLSFNHTVNKEIAASTMTDIGATIICPYLFGGEQTNYWPFTMPVIVQHGSTGFYSADMTLDLRTVDDDIHMFGQTNLVTRDGSNYLTGNIVGLQYKPCSFSIPIQYA